MLRDLEFEETRFWYGVLLSLPGTLNPVILAFTILLSNGVILRLTGVMSVMGGIGGMGVMLALGQGLGLGL